MKPPRKMLALGVVDDCPSDRESERAESEIVHEQTLTFIGSMNEVLNREEIPRTHFLVGRRMEERRDAVGAARLRSLYPRDHRLLELQQYNYSNPIAGPITGAARDHLSAEQFISDVVRGRTAIRDIVGVETNGLRTPFGFDHDLSNRRDILEGLSASGITYVSSDLGSKHTFVGTATAQRQPHTYADAGYPEVVELPSHGFQGDIVTPSQWRTLVESERPSQENVLDHFTGVLEVANHIRGHSNVSVALCANVCALREFDPDLDVLLSIVDRARRRGFEIVSYGEMAAYAG